jgi:hypothetical protein
MKSRTLLLALAMLISFGAVVQARYIRWTKTEGTIPNDGNVYYINMSLTLSNSLYNKGKLDIKNKGIIDARFADFINENEVTIFGKGKIIGNLINLGKIINQK